MREIKFRAWTGMEMEFDVGVIDGKAFRVYGTEWPLMQYTGLKDKNGREIYEGDILVNPEFAGGLPTEVKWLSVAEGCDYSGWLLPCHAGLSIHESKLEVIGNIYENPELLG